jgi:PAS domain S-box-containing protein
MARREPSSPTPMPTILRYGIAVLSVAIAIGLDFFMLRHYEAILTPFLFAVAATVWYAGTGPGVLAIVLSVLSLNYFFLRPFFSFSPISYADLVYLTFCTFCALAVGWVSAVRRRAEQEVRQTREELEAKVMERTANLQRSESYLVEAQRLSHTGTAVFDDTTVLYWSDETYRIFGFDPRNGLPSREAALHSIHPDDRERVQEEARRGVLEKRDYKLEYRLVLPATIKYIEGIAHPKFSASGELMGVVSTIVDVTERKRAEKALRESEDKLRQIMDTVPNLTWSAGSEGKKAEVQPGFMAQVQAILNVLPTYTWYAAPRGALTFVNTRTADYLGIPNDDPLRFGIDIGTTWDEWIPLLHPDDQEKARKYWSNCLRTGETGEYSYRVRSAQGDYRWFLTRFEPLRASDGTLLLWVGATLDIEERRRAEEALRESERSARSAIDGIAGLVAILAPNGDVETVNRPLFEYFGRPMEELKNWGTSDAVHPEDLPRVLELNERGLASGLPFNFELRLRRFDGEYRLFDTRVVPIRDDSGRIERWYNLLMDIEDRSRAEASLQAAQAELAHVGRVMTLGQLTASIAHEVNQPIGSARNNARAALNFLDRSPPDLGEVREALGCIVADAGRAGGIIDRIRDQIKKVPPRSDPFDLKRAIEEIIGLAQSLITENGISVQSRLASGMAPVHGDRVQLQQVVLNLILNAVEAMSSVEADERQLLITMDQSEANGTLVGVRDSGPGIDPKHLELVFEAFYSTKSGMGMGLSICRSIIAGHGGRLWASAIEPRGALFQFTLPDVKSSIARPFTTLESRKKTLL